MPDLYGWVFERIEEREAAARNHQQPCGEWEYDWLVKEVRDLGNAGTVASVPRLGTGEFIALNDPESVLRRCAADRKLLERHRPQQDGSPFPDSMQCRTCSEDGGDGYQYLVPAPCPTLRDLAEGYGWTGE
ncbi:DUF6221 family protein [Streptomyces africanus]|uniref:DUF6221 family protein n=1 Tax=Streptomyces africanus TaxID=231024 RepID=UPI000A3D0F22|nr:DUF6221 family protein [Streptomyces africanus]